MEAKEFYNLAVKLTKDIKTIEPQLVSGSDPEFCMIVTAKKQVVYAGVTSVKVQNGKIMRSCPEFNAIMAMTPSGETLIEKLITISFSTMEISQPCEECLKLLLQVNPNNKNTEIFTAPDKAVTASELLNPEEDSASTAPSKSEFEASGFAASAPDAAAPPAAMNQAPKNPLASASDFGDFSGGFDFEAAEPVEEPDEPEEEQKAQEQAQQNNPDNPFFNPAPPPDAAPQTMAQPYPDQPYGGAPQQYGYPQQPYGYPQQGAYGQQQSMYIQPGQQSMYIQPGQQSMYMQQPNQQSMYIQPGQQSMYIQPGQQSMYIQPGQQSMYMNQSAHSQQVSAYQQSNYYSQPAAPPPARGASTFRNRLANFMDDDNDAPKPVQNTAPDVSGKELQKQAMERKKMAKLEATFKKKK